MTRRQRWGLGWLGLGLAFLALLTLRPAAGVAAPLSITATLPSHLTLAQVSPGTNTPLPPEPVWQLTFDRGLLPDQPWQERIVLYDRQGQAWPLEISLVSNSTLRVTCSLPLPPNATFVLWLSPDLAARDGTTLGAPRRFVYATEDRLRVVSLFPAHGSTDVSTNTEITLVFDRPVVPLQDREHEQPLVLHFDPEVPGQGRWVSTYIYTFTPAQPLQANTTYTVSFDTSTLHALDGTPFGPGHGDGESLVDDDGVFRWVFDTEALTVQAYVVQRNYRGRALLDTDLVVHFSHPMRRAEVEAALSLRPLTSDALTPPLQYEWNEDATDLTVHLLGLLSRDAEYELVLQHDVQASQGGVLPAQSLTRFETIGDFQVLYLKPDDKADPHEFVDYAYVIFNAPVDADSLKGNFQLTPAPEGAENFIWARGDDRLILNRLTPHTTYTLRIGAEVRDIYGQPLGRDFVGTFTTGTYQPFLSVMRSAGTVDLIPAVGEQTLWLRWANMQHLRVTVLRLEVKDWLSLLQRQSSVCRGQPWATAEYDLSTLPRHQVHLWPLDLTQIAEGNLLPPGPYCLHLEYEPSVYGERQENLLFAVVTERLVLKVGPHEALAWVTDPLTGQPRAYVPVTLYGVGDAWPYDTAAPLLRHGQGWTQANGLVHWPYLGAPPRYAIVDAPGRFAFVDADWSPPGVPLMPGLYSIAHLPRHSYQAVVYTDRPLYRPGQTVYFKGLLRSGQDGQYRLPQGVTEVRVWLESWYDDERIGEQVLPVSPWGTFDGQISLSETAKPGGYVLFVGPVEEDDEDTFWGHYNLRVALYHKPVFAVTLTPHNEAVLPGQTVTVDLEATYYAGGGVREGEVRWLVQARPYHFRPPQTYARYRFDFLRDTFVWWGEAYALNQGQSSPWQTARTDEQGRLQLHFDPQPLLTDWDPRQDAELLLQAQVTDVGGYTAEGGTTIRWLRSQIFVGLRTDRWVGTAGQAQTVYLVALTPDGQAVPQHPLQVQIWREQWNTVRKQSATGRWTWESELELVPVGDPFSLQTDDDGRAQFSFVPEQGGTYRFVVTTQDEAGRPREAGLRLWVLGAGSTLWPYTDTARLPLYPDQSDYHPGDTARILVPQTFTADGVALVTVERGRIWRAKTQPLPTGDQILEIPLTAAMAPGVYVTVTALKPAGVTPPDYRVGVLYLPVALEQQTLQVTVTPDRPQAEPGSEVRFTIVTRDTEGNPVPAEVSLALVDKALLALAPDTFDLLQALYGPEHFPLRITTAVDMFADVQALNERLEAEYEAMGPGMGGGGGKGEDLGGVLTLRQSFRDTAFWQGRVQTDEQGRAVVTVTLPDNMTTWVMTARAITPDTRAGQAQVEVQATRPFFVRLHTPAFFTAGDRLTLQAVVHNQTDTALTAEVRLQAEGLTLLTAEPQTVTVPAHSQAIASWAVEVPRRAGVAYLQVQATAGAYADAARPALTLLPEGGLPIYAVTTTESVGTAHMLTSAEQVTEAVRLPERVTDARLEATLSGSLVADLAARLTPPPEWPRSSCPGVWRQPVFTLALGKQIWTTLQPDLPPPVDWDAELRRGLDHLLVGQSPNGAWSFCFLQTDPALTTQVLLALLTARDAGQQIDDQVLNSAAAYLLRQVQGDWLNDSPWEADVAALALYLAARVQTAGVASAIYDLAEDPYLGLAGQAFLVLAAQEAGLERAFSAPLLRQIENGLTFTAQGAHWDRDPASWYVWRSDIGVTAVAFQALLATEPDLPYLHQVARWLMNHSQPVSWSRFDPNSFALQALLQWARLQHDAATDFAYQVYLDDRAVAQGRFTPQNRAKPVYLTWGLDDLQPATLHRVTVRREAGPGALYVGLQLHLTLPAEDLEPRADGISVRRVVVEPTAPEEPLRQARLGALLQVRLTVQVRHDARQVVLTDYVPAGLEPLDPSLYSSYLPNSFTWEDFRRMGWGMWYFRHREVYDDRVVFVADFLPRGTYTVVYYARAAVPGDFQARPAEAYAVQEPDLRGRSAGLHFVVVP